MKAFYMTGTKGSLVQVQERGQFARWADTVEGDTSEDVDPHAALEVLIALAESGKATWVPRPLVGDNMSIDELCDYVGAEFD